MSVKNFLSLTSSITSKGSIGALALLATVGMTSVAKADNSWNYDTVDHGTVSKDLTNVNHTKITVNSQVGIVSGNMDIYAGDRVTVGGTGSIFAYKDNRANVNTQILGRLNSNSDMSIIMVDRDGVFFGADSVVNVGSLVVATGQIEDSQIINGLDNDFGKFEITNLSDAGIEVNGRITVAEAGIAAFVSRNFVNNGTIVAKMGVIDAGKVGVIAGEKVTIDLYGDNLFEIVAGDSVERAIFENNGLIKAEGGEIIMDAQTARDSVDSIINMNGVANVSSATVQGGKIVLSSGSKSKVTVKTGATMNARGTDGGNIELEGGIVEIGKDTKLLADTNNAGNGGHIKLVAHRRSSSRGLLSATGTGGTVDVTTTERFSILDKGNVSASKLRAESVNITAPIVNLDGDIESDNITGTAHTVNVLGSTNNAEIQDAVDLAIVGATVNVGAGIYRESITVDKGLSILGDGRDSVFIRPNSPGFRVNGGGEGQLVTLSGFTVENSTDYGVLIEDTADYDSVTIADARFTNNRRNGVAIRGNASTGSNVDHLIIKDTEFNRNGSNMNTATSLGGGDILAYFYNGDATFENVDINGYAGGGANFGIQLRGTNTPAAAGNVTFDNVNISGSYRRPNSTAGTWSQGGPGAGIAMFTYTDTSNVSFNDVVLDLSQGHGMQLDGLGDGTSSLDIGNTTFNDRNYTALLGGLNGSLALPSQAIFVGTSSYNPVKTNVDATEATFLGADDDFAVEDRVFHVMDDASGTLGQVTWKEGELFVTENTAGIQHAINLSDAGDTVNVDGGTYTEDLVIDKALKLSGNDTTLESKSADSLITVTAAGVNIDPFNFNGMGIADYGIHATGANGLIVDGNNFAGFVKAAVSVNDSNNVKVFGNTIKGGEKGLHGDSAINIQAYDNNISDTTVAGIHIENSDGTGYDGNGKDVDLWNNTIKSASGTGILIENSAFASVGPHPTNPFASGLSGGNKISGGDDAIVIKDSDNAFVAFNTIKNVGGEGILVSGSDMTDLNGNDISNTGENGIKLVESNDGTIQTNTIKNAGFNGIAVIESDNVTVNLANTVNGSFAAGVALNQTTNSRVDGNNLSRTGGSGVWISKAHNSTVSNNVIETTWLNGSRGTGAGVHVVDTNNATVSGNTIDHVTRNGAGVEADNSSITISGNFIGTNRKISGNGITVRRVKDTTISGNTINKVAQDGVRFYGEINNKDINITNNLSIIGDGDGIEFSGNLTGDTLVEISGNENIRGKSGDGVVFKGTTENFVNYNEQEVLIANNTIIGGDDGVSFESEATTKNDIVVRDNVKIIGQAGHGVAHTGGLNNAEILVSGNDLIRGQEDGVRVSGDLKYSSTVDILGNENIRGVNDDGIHVEDTGSIGGVDVNINDNINIHNVGENGIQISNINGAEVARNKVRNAGENGISINGGTNHDVNTNTIRRVGHDGIRLRDFKDAWVYYNNIKWTGDDGIDAKNGDFISVYDNYTDLSGYLPNEGAPFPANVATDNPDANGIYVENVGDDSQPDVVIAEDGFGHSRYGADVEIYGNDVANAQDDGIQVVGTDSHDTQMEIAVGPFSTQSSQAAPVDEHNEYSAYIVDNTVGHVGDDGIDVDGVSYLNVSDNAVTLAGDKGITIDGGHYAGVFGNRILLTGNDGIEIENIRYNHETDIATFGDSRYGHGWAVNVSGNEVAMTGKDGIEVSDSDATLVSHNGVFMAGMGEGLGEVIDQVNEFAKLPKVRNIKTPPQSRDTVGGDIDWDGNWEEASFDWEWGNGNGINVHGIDGAYYSPNGWAADIRGNTVKYAGGHGILAEDNDRTRIKNNRIRYSGVDYASFSGAESMLGALSGGPFTSKNRRDLWKSTDESMITVLDSYFGTISEEPQEVDYVTLSNFEFGGHDGIHAENIYGVSSEGESGRSYRYDLKIKGNKVRKSGDDGIEVAHAGTTIIEENVVRKSGKSEDEDLLGSDGIHVYDVWDNGTFKGLNDDKNYAVTLLGNDINKSGDDGIQVLLSGDTLIKKNTIRNSGTRKGEGFLGADGVNVIAGVRVIENDYYTSIYTTPVSVDVIRNTVTDSLDDGVEIIGASDVLIRGNGRGDSEGILNSGDDGINVLGFASLKQEMGDIINRDAPTASVSVASDRKPSREPEYRVRIVNNTVENSGTEIPEENTDAPLFKTQYDFSHFGGDGIQVEGFNRAVIRGNDVTNSVENGLYVSGANNDKVIVDGNTFTDNDIGAHFESGEINFVKTDREGNARDGNIFNGGRVGLKFSPVEVRGMYPQRPQGIQEVSVNAQLFDVDFEPQFSNLSLKDDDGAGGFGGTIGAQFFNGQSQFFIELDNGAFFEPGTPTVLSAQDSTFVTPFGNITPSAQGNILSDEAFDFINGRIFDFRDRGDLGLFFFGVEESFIVNQEEVFNEFDPYTFGGGNVQVTILGLPSTSAGGGTPAAPFSPTALNSLSPAAGDGEMSPEELNNISTAAGGSNPSAPSWEEAISSAENGGATTFSFGTTLGASDLN